MYKQKTAYEMVRLSHAAELLFLERNVSAEDMDALRRSLQASVETIKQIREHSPKVGQ